MSECVFCKIIANELPHDRIAESTNFIAMLDIAPVMPGHTLIIPKGHATNILELHEALGNELLAFMQRVANGVLAETGSDGFNLLVNTGTAADQAVFHAHLHIIPRKTGDGANMGFVKHTTQTPQERSALATALGARLA